MPAVRPAACIRRGALRTLSRPLEQCVCAVTASPGTAWAVRGFPHGRSRGEDHEAECKEPTQRVRIEIGQGVTITSSITNEAVADLGLQKGDEAWAVIKASDVMIGK